MNGRSRRAANLGGDQIEGRQAVRELLHARRRPVKEVWVSDQLDPAPVVDEILALATERGVKVRTVSRARLGAAAGSDSPQGVMAFASPLVATELDELADRTAGAPFLLVVDGVTDPHNLGTLLRTAEGAGVTGVVVPRHRAVHVTPVVAKAAAGAVEHVRLAMVPGVPAALARLTAEGVWVVGLDPTGPTSLWDLELATEPIALVVGAEGRGLSRLTRQRCELLVHIPQRGAVGSLNVAAAGAVACFEVARRRANFGH